MDELQIVAEGTISCTPESSPSLQVHQRIQSHADAERPDPQGHQLSGGLARFLGLFEQRHSAGDGQGAKLPFIASGWPNAIG